MNSVDSLFKKPFSARSFEEKVQIKTLGRPTPDVNIDQKAKGRNVYRYTRRFHRDIYAKYKWMCGCGIRNALFCFPCLLFGSNDSWSKNGVKDLAHLNEYANKHLSSKKHMSNVLDFTVLGAVNIGGLISTDSDSLKFKNEQIERDRYILSKIIDCIKFCGAFQLALQGQGETNENENSELFLGLINLLGSVDSAVKNHMEESTVAEWTSKRTQNEILQCMLDVCHNKIKEELKETKFVALMAYETADVSEHQQMALVYRYEINGDIYERFWGFFEPDGQSRVDLSEFVLTELNSHFKSTPNKIIAQIYDGTVMTGITNCVQSKIREYYPLAQFIHCYAQQLNLLMEKAASQNKSARVFLSTLLGFSTFFSHSPQHMLVLEKICERRISAGSASRNFKTLTVSSIFENREALVECFLELESSLSKDTVKEARALRHSLQDSEFLFWLNFFHRLIPHINIFYNQLQMRNADSIKVSDSVKNFLQMVNELRKSLETAFSEEPYGNKLGSSDSYRVVDAKEVCDLITLETKCRFESTSHFDVCKLLDSDYFQKYRRIFPKQILDLAVMTYPMLNRSKLKSELSLIYERPEFIHGSGELSLLKMLYSNNLDGVFDEITNLLRIIVTIPVTTAEPGRCFSSLKRIKCFLRNTMKQDRLSALAMLSIEKTLVSSIKNFNSKVIDLFATLKNRPGDLFYDPETGNSSSEADKQSPATATSEKDIEMVICPTVDEVKTEATSWVSESLSEDSSHSGYPSVIPDETRQGTSSSVDIASLPGTSSMNLDPLLAQSSIDNVSLKSEPIEMTPPRLTSRSASPGVQSTTVNQSLNARQQNSSCETRPVSDVQASADLKSKQLDKLLLETNGVDAALDSLEVISKQVNQLDGRDDHFDNFGRYVASLLRSLPTERAVDLQQEVIKLILRSDTCQEISLVDLDSTLTPSSINVSPSTSAPEKVDTHRSPPPPPRPPERLTPSRITPSTVESINVDKSLPLSQQNKRGEKRPCADDSLCEVQTKQSKFDDLLHETEQIDAALKRLQNICNQIDQLCGREDQFDDFGRYTASLLRRFNSKRAVELQEKTINLILRAYISASAVR